MKETRSEILGRRMAENINETANLFYNNRTKANFYRGLTRCLIKRHEVRGVAKKMLEIEEPK
ncbi:hypothetical protein LCGC14_0376570 [marine sediment metagenome]|uniref:Uncharacterized protein n=1 Tax=marine sediment metagenome TaxID=412755 RepID=A0A0F9VQQ5_9ZZZZ